MARKKSAPKADTPQPARTQSRPGGFQAPSALDSPAYAGDDGLDLDSTVDSLMAKLEAPGQDTPDAAPQPQHDEPPEDDDEPDETEPAVKDEEDKPDELELTAEDLEEGETEQEKPDRPEGEPQRHKVTLADGKEVHLTIDELIQGNMLRSDYDRKRGQEAQERRNREAELEAERKAVATEREQLASALDSLKKIQEGGAPTPPDESLLDENSENYDPGRYLQQERQYNKALQYIRDAEAEAAKTKTEQDKAKEAERAEYLKAQMARIPELIPAWTDGQGRIDRQKWESEATAMTEWAAGLGVEPEQVASIDNAASLAILRKAWLYDRAMARKRNGHGAAAPKPVSKKQVVVPSQAAQSNRGSGGDRTLRRAEEQFARRQDPQSGADFLLAKMESNRSA